MYGVLVSLFSVRRTLVYDSWWLYVGLCLLVFVCCLRSVVLCVTQIAPWPLFAACRVMAFGYSNTVHG